MTNGRFTQSKKCTSVPCPESVWHKETSGMNALLLPSPAQRSLSLTSGKACIYSYHYLGIPGEYKQQSKRNSDHSKNQITEDYRSIIRIQLKHVEDITEQLNSNCTVRNVSMSKEPKNAQQSIHRKICRVNGKLRRIESESEDVNGQLKVALYKLVEEINASLRCWCHRKKEGTIKPIQQVRKWKLCRVKDILANLQIHFEQYNAYLSLSTDLPERGKTSERTGI